MSNRSLIEINHDHALDSGLIPLLSRYLSNASKENAEALRRYGMRVVGMRHHADNFIIDGAAEGFPPTYLSPAAQRQDTPK